MNQLVLFRSQTTCKEVKRHRWQPKSSASWQGDELAIIIMNMNWTSLEAVLGTFLRAQISTNWNTKSVHPNSCRRDFKSLQRPTKQGGVREELKIKAMFPEPHVNKITKNMTLFTAHIPCQPRRQESNKELWWYEKCALLAQSPVMLLPTSRPGLVYYRKFCNLHFAHSAASVSKVLTHIALVATCKRDMESYMRRSLVTAFKSAPET
eukprot:404052-Amphidinium_carterae.1